MKKVLLYFLLAVSAFLSHSQGKIVDLSFYPAPGYSQNSTVTINVAFKLFLSIDVEGVYVEFNGNSSGDIGSYNYSVNQSGGEVYLNSGGESYQMEPGNFFSIPVEISSNSYSQLTSVSARLKYQDGSYGEVQTVTISDNNNQ